MIGAGTFINPLFRIIVAVVVLGAVYLFIVKPVLDTTNNAINQAYDNPALKQAAQLAKQNGFDNFRVRVQSTDPTPHQSQRILRCMDRADAAGLWASREYRRSSGVPAPVTGARSRTAWATSIRIILSRSAASTFALFLVRRVSHRPTRSLFRRYVSKSA